MVFPSVGIVKTIRPTSLSRTLALLPPAVGLVAQSASADFSAYIKFDSLNGEATDKGHENWTALPNFSFGFSNSPVAVGGSGGAGAGKMVADSFTFTKTLDRVSPQLFLACAAGSHYDTVKIELVNPLTGALFYRITLNNVEITKLATDGAAVGTTRPTESVSVSYAKIKIEYYYQDPKGGTTAVPPVTWDFSADAP